MDGVELHERVSKCLESYASAPRPFRRSSAPASTTWRSGRVSRSSTSWSTTRGRGNGFGWRSS